MKVSIVQCSLSFKTHTLRARDRKLFDDLISSCVLVPHYEGIRALNIRENRRRKKQIKNRLMYVLKREKHVYIIDIRYRFIN